MRARSTDSKGRRLGAAARLAAALAVVVAGAADAAPVLRKQVDQNGDFILFGNTLGWECATKPPQALPLPPPIAGTVGACTAAGITSKSNVNDSSPDIFWRSDWPAAGQAWADVSLTPADARSTGRLNLPAGATVTYARLYWAAMQPDTLDITGIGTSVLLERVEPSGVLSFSQTVSSDQTWSKLDTGHPEQWYQSTADVTSIVSSLGAGPFRVGSLQRADGVAGVIDLVGLSSEGAFVAWAMVVFYRLPSEPMRNLALFDGFDVVSGTTPATTVDISVSGFQVPSGFQAKLGVLAYEGDNIVTGDSLAFGGYSPPAPPPANPTQLGDAQNPADNFFNGTYSYLGAPVSQLTSAVGRGSNAGDLPQLAGTPGTMSGVDIDVVDVSPYLNAGDTAARILAQTSGDAFVVGALVTSISTLKPDFTGTTKSWQNLTRPSGALAGDVIRYTIVVGNTGNDPSTNTVLTDAIPAGATYLPGSIAVDGVNKTDAQGDDTASFGAGTVTVYLGAGASPTAGGSLPIGGTTTVTFEVTVDGTPGASIDNQATVSAAGQSGNPQTSYPSHPPGGGSGPTSIVIDQCATSADCAAPASACDTASSPHLCVQPPFVVSPPVIGSPTSGATVVTATPTLSGTGMPGASVTVTSGTTSYGPITVDAGGRWSYPLGVGQALAAGSHLLSAVQAVSGVTSDPSGSVTFWVDTTAPAIASPASGLLTNAASLVVLGTSNGNLGGVQAELDDGGVQAAVPIATVIGGSFGFTASGPALGAGTHSFTVRLIDAYGNRSAPSGAVSVTVDRTPPAAPALVVAPALTRHDVVTASGTAEPGAMVTVLLDGSLAAAMATGPGGAFAATLRGLAEGTHQVTVSATDAAWNTGPAAVASFVVDRTPPAPPLLAPLPTATRADPIVFQGTTEPGATVRLLLGGAGVASGIADGTGQFTLVVSSIPEGVYQVTAAAVDAAGNAGAPSPAMTLTVDRTAPTAPVIAMASPTRENPVAIGGSAEPGSIVTVWVDEALAAAAVADSRRAFSVSVGGLGDGAHVVTATAADAAGNVSAPALATFTVDTTAPAPPQLASPRPGQILSQRPVTVAGTTEPNATVSVSIDGAAPVTATAGRDGSFAVDVQAADGGHTVAVTAADAAGNTSAPTTVSFTVLATSASTSLGPQPTPPPSGCGCGQGTGTMGLALIGLPAMWLRRRRAR